MQQSLKLCFFLFFLLLLFFSNNRGNEGDAAARGGGVCHPKRCPSGTQHAAGTCVVQYTHYSRDLAPAPPSRLCSCVLVDARPLLLLLLLLLLVLLLVLVLLLRRWWWWTRNSGRTS
jgi:H+/Cl- antiporter ClcA